MSGNGISFAGLGSGIDTNKIIQQLVQLESLPIQQLEAQKKSAQDKLSSIGTFKGYVKDLQKQAKALSTKKDFLVFGVTPSEDGVASFSASGSAVAGAHTLKVNKLAATDRWAFDGVTSKTIDLASAEGQSVSFDVNGTSYSITVQQNQSSLEEIAAAINDLASADVTATIVNSGTTADPSYKLVLTSNESGEGGRLVNLASTVSGLTIDGTSPDGLGNAQSTNNITAGNNAVAVIDGLTITRETNDFNDVVPGVSIGVEAANPNKTINFSVEADDKAIKKKLQGFVDAYNKVISFVNEQNTYTKEGGPGGDLFGDNILTSVRSSINSALFNVPVDTVMNDTAGYSTLSLVGIKKETDGTLTIDNTVLDDKLAHDINALADLFVDSDGFDNGGAADNTPGIDIDTTADSGLAASLQRAIDRMFRTTNGTNGTVLKGIFDSRTATINANIKRFDDQIDRKQVYIDKFQENLVARFAKLEEVIGGLNAQGAALQNALQGLNG